jgi:hypothetical protein
MTSRLHGSELLLRTRAAGTDMRTRVGPICRHVGVVSCCLDSNTMHLITTLQIPARVMNARALHGECEIPCLRLQYHYDSQPPTLVLPGKDTRSLNPSYRP